jgi:hypothetical protein
MLNKNSSSPFSTNEPDGFAHSKSWSRDELYPILETAVRLQEFRFARQSALQWLISYPGDLPIELIHARALLGEGHVQQAKRVVDKLCARDPEFQQAIDLLKHIRLDNQASPKNALSGQSDPDRSLKNAQKALQVKNLPKAEIYIQKALAEQPNSALAAITHLRIMALRQDTPRSAVQSLAEQFHSRWPECIQFTLILADSLADTGDGDQAVALLHQAASYDITGQVIQRLWGQDHPYAAIWPKNLNAVVNIPIPARLAAALGWNLLPGSQVIEEAPDQEKLASDSVEATEVRASNKSSNEDAPIQSGQAAAQNQSGGSELSAGDDPETLRSVREELERIARRLQRPNLADADARYPTYVIFSTKRGLQAKYGRAGFAMLDAAMQELSEAIRRRPEWGSFVFFADDPTCTTQVGVKPAQAEDAWSLKLALTDLDKALAEKGAMIGALLIVGGPEVVPFHSLPNPTDDPDADVPSDNPYATRDENYFIPEWPVGRLPDEDNAFPVTLLGSLQSMINFHNHNSLRSLRWWQRIGIWLSNLFKPQRSFTAGSFGYSAEVWRKASLEVFQPIGSPKDLVTSPPIDLEEKGAPSDLDLRGRLGYFNLHGLADTGEWYGQRDPSNGSRGTDYPVALRTQDVLNGGRSPEIIFSEACYGAYIFQKTAQNSLALKFLSSGCRALVASTVMSYGSISTPLNAADLLGTAFWKNLREGLCAGEALRRAKIHLAGEMHERQGYLDGEDQKTLISFVLYGDPLATIADSGIGSITGYKREKTFVRNPETIPDIKTVCDRSEVPGTSEPIPEELMTHVKRVVTQYLPGMQGAQVSMSHEHSGCECQGHHCPTGQLGAKTRPNFTPDRRVVTLSKSIPFEEHIHPQFARLTLDKSGKVVKLAVSR